ncbi:ABC transporter permease [candidate division KSB1 bacterium]|nr:ABC transporter permease [candidate division KSB1 bacterium]
MLKNYLKIAFRNLIKHKGYTAINIAGLAVGMACCYLILLYVRHELSYDRFHEKAERIYRVLVTFEQNGEMSSPITVTAAPIAPALQQEYPEVLATVRLRETARKILVTYGEKKFYEKNFYFADAALFELFDFPLQRGDPATALKDPHAIVLSPQTAKKYFGEEDPMGKTLLAQFGKREFKVTGILAGVPSNSHIQPSFIVPFENSGTSNLNNWWGFSYYAYLLLRDGASAAELEQKFPAFIAKHYANVPAGFPKLALQLQPLIDVHLHSNFDDRAGEMGNMTYLYLFSALALFVLVIACINFMNLATARSQHRAKEVGVRKVAGVPRSGLVAQFLGEALLMALIALFVAAGLVEFFLPVFNALSGKILEVNYFQEGAVAGGFVAIALLVGILAGSYPAFFLSRFQPVEVLKGRFSRRTGGARLRQALVVAQFTISIALIAGTVIIHQQLEYMRNKKLGFDKEQVVVVPLAGEEAGRKWPALKTELLRHPEISHVTASTAMPADEGWWQTGARSEGTEVGSEQVVYTFQIDYDFMKTLGIELVAGRDFSPLFASDSSSAFILNEAAVKKFGWASAEAALGQKFVWMGEGPETPKNGTVIGVTKDFHYRGLHEAIAPAVFHLMPYSMDFLALRIPPRQVPQALAVLKNAWAEFDPERPLEYSFLDDKVEALYQSEETLQRIVGLFSALAIFVAGLGLFGLASFTTEQRTKEIGVRKALGASVQQVVLLLSKEFTRLVAIAFLLAAPVAYFAMNKWLQGFAYRTELSPGIFVLAGVLALLIAWLTVSYQAIKAALTNPVEALRYE